MSNSKYSAFVITAKNGSFSKAAAIMGYTQSGVSHLVRALENELGFTLLLRTRNGAKLTKEGAVLLPYIQSLLLAESSINSVVAELKGLQRGSLRVGTFSSITLHYLPSILSVYTARFPSIDVQVVNGTYNSTEAALLGNDLDCAFVTLPSLREFRTFPLCEDRLMAVLPAAHPLAKHSALHPEDLLSEPFIMPAEGSDHDIGRFFSLCNAAPNIRFTMDDDFSAVEMVRHGMGITILPELLLGKMPLADVVCLPLVYSNRQIGIAVNQSSAISPAAHAFIEIARQVILSAPFHASL